MDQNYQYLNQQYFPKIISRIKDERFRVTTDIKYKNEAFQYVAKRTQFEFDKFDYCSTYFMFGRFKSMSALQFQNFSANSFKCALKMSGIHLPRGLLYSIMCFPVAIVDSVNDEIVGLVRNNAPPKHWSAFEMPVVFNLENKMLYRCEITPKWGRIYYDQMRLIIDALLTP